MICSEGIPLYKLEISANKQLPSVSLPCGAAFNNYCSLALCCLLAFSENLEDLLCEGLVIRCSGTVATTEIQSDVICAPSLIAHVMCRMSNLAHESK